MIASFNVIGITINGIYFPAQFIGRFESDVDLRETTGSETDDLIEYILANFSKRAILMDDWIRHSPKVFLNDHQIGRTSLKCHDETLSLMVEGVEFHTDYKLV